MPAATRPGPSAPKGTLRYSCFRPFHCQHIKASHTKSFRVRRARGQVQPGANPEFRPAQHPFGDGLEAVFPQPGEPRIASGAHIRFLQVPQIRLKHIRGLWTGYQSHSLLNCPGEGGYVTAYLLFRDSQFWLHFGTPECLSRTPSPTESEGLEWGLRILVGFQVP